MYTNHDVDSQGREGEGGVHGGGGGVEPKHNNKMGRAQICGGWFLPILNEGVFLFGVAFGV